MRTNCIWNEKMKFAIEADSHRIMIDAKGPIGDDSAMTPKHLLLAGISGCTAMDVVALLKKYKQSFEALEVSAEGDLTKGSHPIVFSKIQLLFKLRGAVDPEKALEAVRLSQTKFCGVTAMVAKSTPISYSVELNSQIIGSGDAQFD